MEQMTAEVPPHIIFYSALWLLLLLLVFLLLAIRKWILARQEWKQRSFSQKLETILLPGEKVKRTCPQKKGTCILTNKRILMETRAGFNAWMLKDIQKIQGQNEAGNRTTVPARMVRLTLKAQSEFTIENTGPEFEALARQLLARKQKKAKTKGK